MTDDPITAALQQLADHHDQLTQLTDLVTGIGDTLREHQAALEKLAEIPDADPDGYRPYPPPSPPAGARTTCACTAWTSSPTCGPSCTSSPNAPRGRCRPRPNTRPASCPPWPPS